MNFIKIKKSKWSIFLLFCIRILSPIFVELGLRKSKNFWGIIYDSRTKQPLDPVMVKLVSAGNKKEVQNCITDMSGRYGFLANPGKYKIIPKKSNYIFPSKIATAESDGIFENIYHGDFFEVLGESDCIAPNIPMDSVAKDWNQEAKLKYTHTYPNLQYFVRILLSSFFWISFILDAAFLALNFFKNFSVSFGWQFKLLVVYFFIFFLNWILPEIRLWGQVSLGKNREPLEGILLEVLILNFPDTVLTKTITNSEGKFFLRVNPGKYILRFSILEENGNLQELGQVNATAHFESVLNNSYYLD